MMMDQKAFDRQQNELETMLGNCRGTFFALGLQLRQAREKATGQQAEKIDWIIGQLAALRHQCGEEVMCLSPGD